MHTARSGLQSILLAFLDELPANSVLALEVLVPPFHVVARRQRKRQRKRQLVSPELCDLHLGLREIGKLIKRLVQRSDHVCL